MNFIYLHVALMVLYVKANIFLRTIKSCLILLFFLSWVLSWQKVILRELDHGGSRDRFCSLLTQFETESFVYKICEPVRPSGKALGW